KSLLHWVNLKVDNPADPQGVSVYEHVLNSRVPPIPGMREDTIPLGTTNRAALAHLNEFQQDDVFVIDNANNGRPVSILRRSDVVESIVSELLRQSRQQA